MSKLNHNNLTTPIEDFDWSEYEGGWNGVGLKRNAKVGAAAGVCYSHAAYAQELYDMYSRGPQAPAKELSAGAVAKVTNLERISDTEVMATVMNGANNIVIDMSKEARFISLFRDDEGNPIDKATFINSICVPSFKKSLLDMNLSVQVNNGEKASLWDGYVTDFMNELKGQIASPTRAYVAHIDDSNNGGFIVTIAGVVKAFMPGSMAASNRISDFESYIGKDLEVMVENYDKRYGFVVSRKKYLKSMAPQMLLSIQAAIDENPDTVFVGKVTGSTKFGVFVELNEFITGMIHKSCMSPDLYDRIKDGGDASLTGESIDVYVHEIGDNKVFLSDMPLAERTEQIEMLEARAAEKGSDGGSRYGKPYRQKKGFDESAPASSVDIAKLKYSVMRKIIV